MPQSEHVPKQRRRPVGLRPGIERVDVDGLVRDVLHPDVADVDILDHVATPALGLEAPGVARETNTGKRNREAVGKSTK
jgi:hypothetical protein